MTGIGNFFISMHQWLIGHNAQAYMIAAIVVSMAMAAMAIIGGPRKVRVLGFYVLNLVLVVTAFALYLTGSVGWVVALLLVAFVNSLSLAGISIALQKGLRAVLSSIAAALTLTAATQVAAARFTAGDFWGYFLGDAADNVRWLAGEYVLFGVPLALVATIPMYFVWGRRKAKSAHS